MRPLYNIGYVAYFELNLDYIIETYCINKEEPELKCNGKCHLATQLMGNVSDNDETPYVNSIFEAFVPVYFQDYGTANIFNPALDLVTENWNYSNTFFSLFRDHIDPPPRV
ncbi:hypothetical protein [Tamlana crocina]|uniref:Uncharacterized protein n=1 Tax=Tamlana crocina TaxID=393006 RepID=A0ABX1D6P7_9FLAO|nr:hypothetical protein [Tamlana crocina]NJX13965.1 hypothetical protein [Tamlana crocina]